MTFTQTLALAKQHNIDILDLDVAYEVACIFGEEHERYEDICKAVYNLYMKTDRMSINCLACALQQCIDEGEATLDGVLAWEEDFNTVVEWACSLDL